MNTRSYIIRGLIISTVLVFAIRLFSIQILDEDYKAAAQNNIVQKSVLYPYRGLIYDRNGQLIVHNDPIYTLNIIPTEFQLSDSSKLCNLLAIDHTEFQSRYSKARGYSPYLASPFYDQVSKTEFAKIQDELIDIQGLTVSVRTIRGYDHKLLANVLGYIAQISRQQLEQDQRGYYRSGDIIGISGIEKQYEHLLRGTRGSSLKIVNVQGKIQGEFRDGKYDSLPIPGKHIQLTIDFELQKYAEFLMENKVGSLVALDPRTGEVLAFVSTPSYNPNLLTGRLFSENFKEISSDTLKPLFNRPLQAMYPPGSMFKTIQALIALQEKRIRADEQIYCEGDLIGDLAPPGSYDVIKAITYSSNNYFYKVLRRIIQAGKDPNSYIDSRIGYEQWYNHVRDFGLGQPLGIDLANEKPGFIPDLNYYDKIYGINRWRFSNIYSLSIGQGELLVTPLQMANLAAILGNRGHYFTPHFLKSVEGDSLVNVKRVEVAIDSVHFEKVVEGIEQVILYGSGIRAYVRDISICGKTSTVQNPHGEDHSGFMGFAPKEMPQIAVAVYVENAGQGGRAAASTASLIIEKYIKGEITRPWVENYVLNGVFVNERRKPDESN